MASYYLSPISSIFQYFSDVGVPLSGGLLWTYAAGTSTPAATYTDITGSTPNSNPIQLNAAGRLQNVQVWQAGGQALKVQVSTNAGTVGAPVFGVQIGPTFDQVSGIDDPLATTTALANPASGFGADLVANAMRSYDLVSSVRASNVPTLSAGETLIIELQGQSLVNDGGGGFYYWNAASTATDDGFNVIKPTAGTTGRYLRLLFQAGQSGSFTTTLTGCTTSPTVTVYYYITGASNVGVVTVNVVGASATSNATSFGLAAWNGLITPVTKTLRSPLVPCTDNGGPVSAQLVIPPGGAPTIAINNASGLWTNSATKALGSFSFTYYTL